MQIDWLRRIGAGLDKGDTLILIAESERFALVKFPGHSYWSGRGQTSYAQTTYYIVKKGTPFTRFNTQVKTGRASQDFIAEMKTKLKDLDGNPNI